MVELLACYILERRARMYAVVLLTAFKGLDSQVVRMAAPYLSHLNA